MRESLSGVKTVVEQLCGNPRNLPTSNHEQEGRMAELAGAQDLKSKLGRFAKPAETLNTQ